MRRDNQIEEMAQAVCELYKEFGSCEACDAELDIDGEPCIHECFAKAFYNAGYRKASDVAKEIFAEIEKLTASVYNDFMFNRDGVGMNAHYVVQFSDELDIAIAELKKKYTEEGKC